MSHPTRVLALAAAALLGVAVSGCATASGAAGGGGGDVATVNDQKITRSDFDAKLESGPQAKQVLQQLVQGALIDQYAKDNKIDIADADVQKQEDDIKSKYPPGQFEQILKSQNLTETDVHNILRQKLIVEKGVAGSIHVTDADVASYLAKNHASLDTAEQVRAKHILVANLPTAEIVEGKLKAGGDFAALAKQYSTDPSSKDKGGELGFFGKGQMVPAFQAAAFSQPIGAVGKPVKSPFGYHIIVVEEKKPAQVATLANSSDKIKTLLQQQQEQQQIPTFLAALRAKANIQVLDPNLKDALPPAGPAPAAGAAGAGAAPAPAPAAS
jgi:foldase protein PrsA